MAQKLFNLKIIIVSIVISILPTITHAKHLNPESWYQENWCKRNNGVIEHILPDRTRVDCLTETHAIEMDFARKWAEAIGQSLHYSKMTGKRAGIVLIIEKHREHIYTKRIINIIRYFNLPIDIWEVTK